MWMYRLQGLYRLEKYLNLEGTRVRSPVKWSLFPRPWPELSSVALLCVCEQRRLRWVYINVHGLHRLENYLNLEGTRVRSVKWSLFPRSWPELSSVALLCVREQRRLRWDYINVHGLHRLENYLNLEGTSVRSSVKWSLFPRPQPEPSSVALLCVREQRRLRWDYLNVQAPEFAQAWKVLEFGGILEKSLQNKSALKSTGKSCKGLEKSLKFSVGINTVNRDLNQNRTVWPLFGAANAAPNKGKTILY